MFRLTKNKKHNKKSRWLRIIRVFGILFMIGAGFYIYTIYSSVSKAVETMHEPIDRQKSEQQRKKIVFEENDEKEG